MQAKKGKKCRIGYLCEETDNKINMRSNRLLFIFAMLFTLGLQTARAQNIPLYAAYVYDDSIWALDTTAMAMTVTARYSPTTSSGGTVEGFNGMATHPCTGDIYVIEKITSVTGRVLGIWDPITDAVTEIGNTGDNFAGITFSNDGRLWGVTGDGANTPESFFEINITTAATTLKVTMGGGSDGESIAYCTDNGKVYHWSGRDTNPYMSKIDTSGVDAAVTRSGYNYDEVFGSVYLGQGFFLLANLDQEYVLVDTSGFAVNTGVGTHEYQKGLAFPVYDVQVSADDTLCAGEMWNITILEEGYDSMTVDYGDGTIEMMAAVDTSLTHMFATPGTYSAMLIIYRPGCRADTLSGEIVVNNIPNVGINPGPMTYYCTGDSVMLTGSSGGSSQWYMDGAAISGATSNTYYASMPGLYNMVKTNQNGCSDSASVGVMVMEAPASALTVSADTICGGDSTLLGLTPGGAPGYQWYVDGNMIPGATGDSLWAIGPGEYTVTLMWNSQGCVDSLVSSMVSVNPMPMANFTQSADTVWLGQSVTFTDGSADGVVGYDFGDGNTSTMSSPTHTYGATGSYTVTQTVTNDCGSDTFTGTVVVIDTPIGITDPLLIAGLTVAPNPFNDLTEVRFETVRSGHVSVAVYNLLGERVVLLEDGLLQAGAHSVRWNGRDAEGREATAGMYMLRIRMEGQQHTVRVMKSE